MVYILAFGADEVVEVKRADSNGTVKEDHKKGSVQNKLEEHECGREQELKYCAKI